MDFDEAKSILGFLANGINPISGEILPEMSPYNEPKVIRALFTVLGSSKNKKAPEEKQQENIVSGRPKNAGLPWTNDLKKELEDKFMSGIKLEELVQYFERTKGSIVAELLKQGLIEKAVADAMR